MDDIPCPLKDIIVLFFQKKFKKTDCCLQGDETTVKLGTYRGKLETVWSECGADPSAYQGIIYLDW